jgi:peptidyl-prolyl cis-trans isomerase B (cyclophilin B)
LLVALVALLSAGALVVSGCSSAEPPAAETPAADSQPAEQPATNSQGETLYTPAYVPNGNETATFKTSKGVIVVKLFGKDAPIHVGNFVELARKGFYDDTKFHRYEPGFVIQGGDPQTQGLTSEQVQQALQTGNPPLGTGGPGYVIKGEFDPAVNPNKHVKGALGMARTNDPDSAGSQFYFALEPLAALDGQYTVFGTITEGQDVADQLRVGDTIESVTIDNAN